MSERTPTLRPWHVRFARPTARLEETARLYAHGLGLERLSSFVDHAGFDGVMLGDRHAGWHLELTSRRDHPPEPPPSPEQHLVFYVPDDDVFASTCTRMLEAGFRQVRAVNPYWDRVGRTFEDMDGHRVVVAHEAWRASS